MSPPPLCILLATFNGERFVEQQVKSIQAQSRTDWILLVRDDHSTDTTCDILRELAQKDPRITLLDSEKSAGASANFGHLMQQGLDTNGQLFFFCDQDDTWHPDKLQRLCTAFSQAATERRPVLVHSDLEVVDENLETLNSSLIRFMALDPTPEPALNYLLTRNCVTGCAMACNRSLLEQALPLPNAAIMHDWWLALIAACHGTIHFVDQPLVKYRQHDLNAVGAKGFWHGLNPTRNWLQGWREGDLEFIATVRQAQALLQHASARDEWGPDKLGTISAYSGILQASRGQRLRLARRLKLRLGNRLLSLILYARLLGLGRELNVEHRSPRERG